MTFGQSLRAPLLNRKDPVKRLRHQRRHFIPPLPVHYHRRPGQVAVIPRVERARPKRLHRLLHERLQDDGGDASSHRLGNLPPLGVGEMGAGSGPVEVLGRPASLPRADQLDALELLQHIDVVGDLTDPLVELFGQLRGAGDPFVEDGENPHAQGICERLDEAVAPFYDRFTANHDYEAWTSHLEAVAIKHGLKGSRLLDVACGTGKSFAPFLRRGYEVTACDISAEMLIEARAKTPQATLERWDMRELPMLGRFDLVTCLDDSLNYLLEVEEFEAALRGISRNLAPGGVCLFDLNTLSAYRTDFASDEVSVVEGILFLWRGETDSDLASGSVAQASIKVFEPTSENLYRRTTTRHLQRHHPPEAVFTALRSVGLECVGAYAQVLDGSLETGGEDEPTHKTVYAVRHR
jgi:SAM-dependent methyltransferase